MDLRVLRAPAAKALSRPAGTFIETHGLEEMPTIEAWRETNPVQAEHGVAFLLAVGDMAMPVGYGFDGGLQTLKRAGQSNPSEAVFAACRTIAAAVWLMPAFASIADDPGANILKSPPVAFATRSRISRGLVAAANEFNYGGGGGPARLLLQEWELWELLEEAIRLVMAMIWSPVGERGIPVDVSLLAIFTAARYYEDPLELRSTPQ